MILAGDPFHASTVLGVPFSCTERLNWSTQKSIGSAGIMNAMPDSLIRVARASLIINET